MNPAQSSVTGAFAIIGAVIMLRHGWFKAFRDWAKSGLSTAKSGGNLIQGSGDGSSGGSTGTGNTDNTSSAAGSNNPYGP